MASNDRRQFLGTCALASASLCGGLVSKLAAAAPATGAKLSIARYKVSPQDPEGVAEEARRLTRKAIEGLGGMARFVSRGDVVWIKPNIAWDRRPEQAATTNPDVVATLVTLCLEAGAKRVMVSDNSTNVAQRAFPRSGIQPAAEKAGARVELLDPIKFK
ncbi:MAG: DUF362 domain-containing protein, partial [Vicinamibacteria bacterium]|nr:DUF362 domain-containing protein [Vicinamibacteria bacterium]